MRKSRLSLHGHRGCLGAVRKEEGGRWQDRGGGKRGTAELELGAAAAAFSLLLHLMTFVLLLLCCTGARPRNVAGAPGGLTWNNGGELILSSTFMECVFHFLFLLHLFLCELSKYLIMHLPK